MAADSTRTPSAVSKVRRCKEIRELAYVDEKPGALTIHDDYESVALPATEGAAAWGDPFRVFGYDNLTALLHMTKAAGTLTAVNVAVQVSYVPNPTNSEWYDLYEDEAGDGVLVRKVYVTSIAVAELRVGWHMPVRGKNMRVKLWGTTADGDSRAIMRVIRSQDAWGS